MSQKFYPPLVLSYSLSRFLIRFYPPTLVLEYEIDTPAFDSVLQEQVIYRTIQINDPLIRSSSLDNDDGDEMDKLAECILDKIPATKIYFVDECKDLPVGSDEWTRGKVHRPVSSSTTKSNSSTTKTTRNAKTTQEIQGVKDQSSASVTTTTKFQLSPHQRKCFKPQILQILSILRDKFVSSAIQDATTSSAPSNSQYRLVKLIPPAINNLPITNLSLNKSGDRMATGSYDRTAKIYDTMTGQLLSELTGHKNVVYTVNFNRPYGNRLLTGSFDHTARIWDSETGESLCILNGHRSEVVDCCWNEASTLCATGGMDHSARVFDLEREGCLVQTFVEHDAEIVAVAFDPFFGDLLLTGSFDHTAVISDTRTGRGVFHLKGHQGELSRACWNPVSPHLVATVSIDNNIGIWDLRKAPGTSFGCGSSNKDNNKSATTPATNSPANKSGAAAAVASSPKIVAPAPTPTTQVDHSSNLLLRNGHVAPLSKFLPEPGTHQSSVPQDLMSAPTVKFNKRFEWMPEASQPRIYSALTTRTQINPILGPKFDDKRMSTIPSPKVALTKISPGFLFYLRGFTDECLWGEFNPATGTHFLAAGADNTVRVFDVRTGSLVQKSDPQAGEVTKVTYNSQGTKIFSAGSDKTCRVWKAPREGDTNISKDSPASDKLELLQVLHGHQDEVFSVEVNYEGDVVATAGKDNDCRIWKC